jgi:hypothetical protein
MKYQCLILAAVAALLAGLLPSLLAHPGSGIVVDAQGQVFFQDSAARTIWKIDTQGKVTPHSDKLGGHWMALDRTGKFAQSDLKLVERVPLNEATPALLVADGGAPIAVADDGNLYYGLSFSTSGGALVGLTRIVPTGQREIFAPELAPVIEKLGVTGLASGPGGTIYAACLTDLIQLRTNGTFTILARSIVVKNCDSDAPTCFLRGLDVDARGTVYAAATGCRSVIKIGSDGKIETLLKAEPPWSPTGVAIQNGEIYVLEYTNANGALRDGWLPRVRRLGRDGTVATLATISEQRQRAQPNRQPDP